MGKRNKDSSSIASVRFASTCASVCHAHQHLNCVCYLLLLCPHKRERERGSSHSVSHMNQESCLIKSWGPQQQTIPHIHPRDTQFRILEEKCTRRRTKSCNHCNEYATLRFLAGTRIGSPSSPCPSYGRSFRGVVQQICTKPEASERDVETGIREGTYGLAIGLGRELGDEAYTASVFVEGWIIETQIPFWHCRKTRLHDTQKRCSCRTFQVLPPELAAAAPPPPPPLPLTSVASNSIVLFPESHVPGGSLQQVAGSIDCRRRHQRPAGGSTTLVLGGGGGKACCGGWRDDAAAAACCLTTTALSSW